MTATVRFVIDATNKASAKVKKVDKDLAELMTDVGVGVGILGGFALATKEAFDLGKEGAAIQQTEASFNNLMRSMGHGPEILSAMRAATLGTVDDMSLMSAELTVLAGASDDVAQALVDNTPRLLEIAKAANKLNPTLGTTSFQFESLARGIKRSSPLILDNLGLTIKVGEANENYALKIGKTVEELSAQEKQLALLEEVLRSGDTLIQQVGGSTESATDAIAKMESDVKNAADALKTAFAPAVSNVAVGLSTLLTWSKAVSAALEIHEKQTIETADSWGEYAGETLRAREAANELDPVLLGLAERVRKTGEATAEEIELLGLMTPAMFEALRAGQELEAGEMKLLAARQANWEATHLQTEALGEQIDAELEAKIAADALKQSYNDLRAAVAGPFREAFESFSADQEGLRGKLQDLQTEIDGLESKTYLTAAQKEQLSELKNAFAETQIAITEGKDEHNNATEEMLFNLAARRAETDGVTSAELELLTRLGEKWGLIDEVTAEATLNVDAALTELAEGQGIEQVLAEFDAILERIHQMNQGVDIPVTVNGGSSGGGGGAGSGPGGPQELQFGYHGFTDKPTLFMTSEHGQREHVSVTPGGLPPGGMGPTQISMNIDSKLDAERLALEVIEILRRKGVS